MIASMQGLTRAIEKAGGVGALASLIGVRQSAVSNWRTRGNVPVKRCHDIVNVCGGAVSLSDLRPDIWPPQESRAIRAA